MEIFHTGLESVDIFRPESELLKICQLCSPGQQLQAANHAVAMPESSNTQMPLTIVITFVLRQYWKQPELTSHELK